MKKKSVIQRAPKNAQIIQRDVPPQPIYRTRDPVLDALAMAGGPRNTGVTGWDGLADFFQSDEV